MMIEGEQYSISSKELYKKLGLSESNYSHWCKRNILENEALREGIDYKAVVSTTRSENELGLKPNYGQEYLLSFDAAADLAMETHTEKGREVRDSFIKATTVIVGRLMNQVKQLSEQINMLEQKVDLDSEAIIKLNSGRSVSGGKLSEWAQDRDEKLDMLAEEMGYTKKDLLSRLIKEMEEEFGIVFQKWMNSYRIDNPDIEGNPWRICVLDYYDELEEWFDEILKRYLDQYGLGSSNENDPIAKYGDDPAFWEALERSAEMYKENAQRR